MSDPSPAMDGEQQEPTPEQLKGHIDFLNKKVETVESQRNRSQTEFANLEATVKQMQAALQSEQSTNRAQALLLEQQTALVNAYHEQFGKHELGPDGVLSKIEADPPKKGANRKRSSSASK